jgi:hypothetical protein
MKLECPVVKDLYVLYSENELSEEVREAVEEHLGECEKCKRIYNTGVNFQTAIQTETVSTTKKLDDKILMKLKLARLKGLLLFIIILLGVISYNIYSQSRRYLSVDVSKYASDIEQLRQQVEALKFQGKDDENSRYSYNYSTGTLLSKINTDYEPIYRNFNPFEKYSLKKLSSNQCFDLSLTNLMLMLSNRMENGYWSDNDEKAYSVLEKEIDNLAVMSRGASNGLNSEYYMVNTKEFLISFNKINELSKIYTKYNKLPEEITFLSQDQLKSKIEDILKEDIEKIELRISDNDNNNYDFTAYLKDDSYNYVGTIDAYSGRIIRFTCGELQTKGMFISVEKAKEIARDMVLRDYGRAFDIKIKDLGINSNYFSDDGAKVYCFEVQLTFKGYKVVRQISIHIDGYTSKILEFTVLSDTSALAESKELTVNIKITPELALQNIAIENSNKDNFIFTDTYFIKSMFSGEYVLVYEYRGKENKQAGEETIYINTNSGKMESPAYEDGIIRY